MIKEKSPFVNNLSAIYSDILSIKINSTDSFQSSTNKFYEVMRKWGVCQGNWTEYGSRLCNTPEWNMCFQLFRNHKLMAYDIWNTLSEPPKDLLAYGKQPKTPLLTNKKK